MRVLRAGFPCMNKEEKPMKNAKIRRKMNSPEIRRATMARALHPWARSITGFLPCLSDNTPQEMSPAAVLRLTTLWTTPRDTTLTPVERI